MNREVAPMDEPPFLDTDVARASVLLTLEDLAFFLDEFGLGHREMLEAASASGARYASIEVRRIEISAANWRSPRH